MIIVGIPSLNRLDLLTQCIDSALVGSVPPDRIYVVDNSGGAYGDTWAQPYQGRVKVHRAPTNYGVARSWNVLARAAWGLNADVILSNDDITFAPDTIQLLMAEAARSPRAGIVSAIEGHRFALFWLRRAAWEDVGPFDEAFYPAYYEDNDWHRRATLAHWASPVAPSAAEHVNSATFQAKDAAAQEAHHKAFRANRVRYVRKWGGTPGEEQYAVPFGARRV